MGHIEQEQTTYLRHFRRSMSYSGRLLVGSACAFGHAIFPELMQDKTTRLINKLYIELKPRARPKPVSKGLRANKKT